ncbi:MAG: long-chain acyl-CoA synthetase [Paracoccaceae bacterium]|jgi:long-chain acyl-CoA synthetase
MTVMTLQQAADHITATDPRFAVTTADIGGVTFRVFKNAPPHIRAMMQIGAEAHGPGDYLIYQDERWSYDEFCTEVARIGHALTDELGLRPGDRVAIAMRNYPELLILFMAIASVGGVTVLLNAWWTGDELDYAFGDSGAKIVFADGPRYAALVPVADLRGLRMIAVRDAEGRDTYANLLARAHRADWPDTPIEPDDDFALMYSSGTTGHPKGVMLTHRGAVSAIWTWFMAPNLAPLMGGAQIALPEAEGGVRPAILIVTPLFHITATHPMFLLSIPLGSRIVLLRKWDADEAVRVIEAEKVTRFLGVPTQSAELMEAVTRLGVTLPTLDYVGAGGAKRPAAQVEKLAGVFPAAMIASGWGMTETNAAGLSISGPDYVARPAAAGRLVPPLQDLKLIDEAGDEVALGEIGEIAVKSPMNMRCYINKPEATAETLQDGWLRTGDLATLDADGYVTIVDRRKSIIIRGGENISCLDVEGALHRHPDVVEAGVFPVPDTRLGEIVGAAVLLRPGAEATSADLRAFLAEHIARFKIPERIWLRESALPRGATAKIDRRALRAECLAFGAPAPGF